jgi:hypothetical protein
LAGFLHNLLRRLRPGGRAAAPRRGEVHVAAFGKHPGWDDHVELGLNTTRLAEVRQSFYVEGIAGNVDSGAWDKLPAESRLAEFDHAMLLQAPGEVIAGRFWSSRDRKGRGRYPMVACAHAAGMSIRWALRTALPALERLKMRCQEATTAESVTQAIDAAQQELLPRAATSGDGQTVLADAPPSAVLPQLLGRPELGENHRGLLAAMYHLERAMTSIEGAAAHLRLPACADSFADAAEMWVRFLADRVTPAAGRGGAAPILALQPLGQAWIDLIVGRPRAADMYCILATPAALPLTTDIPYNLEPEFVQRARASLNGAAGAAATFVRV